MASKKTKKSKAVAKKPVAKAKVIAKATKVTKKSKPAKKAVAKKSKPAAKAKAKVAPKVVVKAEKAKPVPVPPKKPNLVVPKNTGTKQFTQSEFFDSVQSYCGFTKRKEAKEFYDQFSGMIQNALKSGYKLVLPGLGKMQVRKTKARKGINPATRESIMIPAKRKVAFTPLKALKTAVL